MYLLAKATKIEIYQKIKPIKSGLLKIKGLITKCFNMSGFHAINPKGICQNYLDKYGEKGLCEIPLPQMNLHEIEIFDQQPELKVIYTYTYIYIYILIITYNRLNL